MSGYNFQKILYFLSEDLFYLYSVDPDEMQHYATFHQGLHCLQKYLLRGFCEYKGLKENGTIGVICYLLMKMDF